MVPETLDLLLLEQLADALLVLRDAAPRPAQSMDRIGPIKGASESLYMKSTKEETSLTAVVLDGRTRIALEFQRLYKDFTRIVKGFAAPRGFLGSSRRSEEVLGSPRKSWEVLGSPIHAME